MSMLATAWQDWTKCTLGACSLKCQLQDRPDHRVLFTEVVHRSVVQTVVLFSKLKGFGQRKLALLHFRTCPRLGELTGNRWMYRCRDLQGIHPLVSGVACDLPWRKIVSNVACQSVRSTKKTSVWRVHCEPHLLETYIYIYLKDPQSFEMCYECGLSTIVLTSRMARCSKGQGFLHFSKPPEPCPCQLQSWRPLHFRNFLPLRGGS